MPGESRSRYRVRHKIPDLEIEEGFLSTSALFIKGNVPIFATDLATIGSG